MTRQCAFLDRERQTTYTHGPSKLDRSTQEDNQCLSTVHILLRLLCNKKVIYHALQQYEMDVCLLGMPLQFVPYERMANIGYA